MSDSNASRLPLAQILIYAGPALGTGFLYFYLGSYLMIFATDVLALSPVFMGAALGISRVWDAVSDPMAGYLSDRTRTRIGRRRPWMLAGALPIAVLFALLWSPPLELQGRALQLWTGALVILVYTALTVGLMPHDALGAELATGYTERNRVFGWRRVYWGLGALSVFAAMAWVREGGEFERERAALAAWAGGGATAVLLMITGALIRERPENQGRGGRRPLGAFADVLRNPHARLLLVVFLCQQLALGALVTGMGYWTAYILGDPALLGWLLGVFYGASLLGIPFWLLLGRRFEKHTLVLAAMTVVVGGFLSLLFFGEGDLPLVILVAALVGFVAACNEVLVPSLQADVIDWDEVQTGERKEGVYFALWAFAAKTAQGVAGIGIGVALELARFAPNVEPTPQVRAAILFSVSALPALLYALGTLLFTRFRLDRRTHAELRAALEGEVRRES